jgi:hypothetical protein
MLAKKHFTHTCPIPPNETASEEYKVAKKQIGRAEGGSLCWCTDIVIFQNTSLHGFPTAADPADRNCRYLV